MSPFRLRHRIGLRPAQADVMVKMEGADPFVEPERRLERSFLPTDFGEEPKRKHETNLGLFRFTDVGNHPFHSKEIIFQRPLARRFGKQIERRHALCTGDRKLPEWPPYRLGRSVEGRGMPCWAWRSQKLWEKYST